MDNSTTDLNTELRGILETEGALTDEQVARVDVIETELAALESEARSANARATAEARLNKPSFSSNDVKVVDTRSETDRFADWAIGGDTRALAGLGNSGTSGEGNLLPLDLQSELVGILNGVPGIRQVVDVRSYGYDVEIARVASRPSITSYTGEAADYDAIQGSFDQIRSYAFKSTAQTAITEELMQDSRPAVLTEIMEAQMAAHALFWDKKFATDGEGGSTGPEAIFDSSVAGLNTMDTASSGVVTADDVLKAALVALPAQYRGGAMSIVCHPEVEHMLRTERDETGRFSLLGQAAGTDAGVPGTTVAGMPIAISTNAPTLAEAADGSVPVAMLLNKASYRIFDRMPMSTMRDEFSLSASGQVNFLSKMRSDGRWLAPWRSVAISLAQ